MDKILVLFSLTLGITLFSSCIIDKKVAFRIKNSTADTLLIEFSDIDTLDNCIYWKGNVDDSSRTLEKGTNCIYIHGEKVAIDNSYYAPPDSMVCAPLYSFYIQDTCYIYAINWYDATHYTLDEIRQKNLYTKRLVTKGDFKNRLYEYRP